MAASARPRASHFQRALAKYGLDGFEITIIEECGSKPLLNQRERFWISHHSTMIPNGYNLAAGGEGSLTGRRTQAWRDSVTSEAFKEKHRERMLLIRGTEEFTKLRDETSERVKVLRGSLTEEQRERWRINAANARRGIPAKPFMFGDTNPAKRPDIREKIRQSKLGKPRSPECRAKIAQLLREAWASGKFRTRKKANRNA